MFGVLIHSIRAYVALILVQILYQMTVRDFGVSLPAPPHPHGYRDWTDYQSDSKITQPEKDHGSGPLVHLSAALADCPSGWLEIRFSTGRHTGQHRINIFKTELAG